MLQKLRSKQYVIAILVVAGVLYMLPLQYFLSSPSLGSFYSMIAADGGVSVERGVSYGSHTRHKLDIYRPVNGEISGNDTKSGPILMFIYGGSWREGDRALYGFVGAALASRGITTIIPDYRLYPDVMFPAFVNDAAKAYRWVHDNLASAAHDGEGKKRPIILMGHSAGAHIAALLTVDQSYLAKLGSMLPRPTGLISLAGPLAFDPTTDHTTKDVFASVADANIAKPISFVQTELPPTLLIHGLDDKTVGPWNSRDFAKAMIKTKIRTCKLEVSGIGHVGLILSISKPLRWRAPVLKSTVKFINGIDRGDINRSDIGC